MTGGVFMGYQQAHRLCAGTVGCGASAHICTAGELIRFAELGLPATAAPGVGYAWYATGL